MYPSRSHYPPVRPSYTREDKCPFIVFATSNHATFLVNPYSSLRDLGDIQDFDIEDPEIKEFDGDMHLNSAK